MSGIGKPLEEVSCDVSDTKEMMREECIQTDEFRNEEHSRENNDDDEARLHVQSQRE